MKWTKGRLKELGKFRTLLREVASMNHGSGITRRILACEKLANELNRSDISNGRESFVQFLNSLALDERKRGDHGGK